MFLRNCWYVAGWSHQLLRARSGRPMRVGRSGVGKFGSIAVPDSEVVRARRRTELRFAIKPASLAAL